MVFLSFRRKSRFRRRQSWCPNAIATEQAIAELAGVQHCEARVSEDNQRLVLLVSGSSSEAELKQKALSLGRGYMLSQVKMVDSGDWKFNALGKLLRNAVPLEEVVREVKQSADLGGGGPDVVHCGAGGSSLEQRYLVPEQSPQRAAGFREQAVAGHRAGALHAGPRQEQELRTPQLAEAVRDGAGPGDLGPAGDGCSTATPR
ncbi:unnamed protein product [Effrenium voratum]|uniref:Uncharacterized protein n=1 Tax=Effrenium voratum TaxID=2562239 RepID=A0AA36I5F5_9DINO|nr:unnamed protein product [Effrenium voratum]